MLNTRLTLGPLQYETELARVRQVRKERLGTFIEKVRDEIQALWDALLYGQQTMELFEPFFSGK